MSDKRLQEYLKKFDWLWENNAPLIHAVKEKKGRMK